MQTRLTDLGCGDLPRGYRQSKSGFTLVELLVVIAIIAILIALLLPAVQAVREAARRTGCNNHLHQVAISCHNYHSIYQRLPSGWTSSGPNHSPGWGWAAGLLPQLERSQVHQKIRFDLPVDDSIHQPLMQLVIGDFVCPSDNGIDVFEIAESHDEHDHEDEDDHGDDHGSEAGENVDNEEHKLFKIAKANYVGVFGSFDIHDDPYMGDGLFYGNSRHRFRDILDGLSNTLLCGERSSDLGGTIWHGVIHEANAAEARVVGVTDHRPNDPIRHFEDFSSKHPGGAVFALADGSVRFVSESIDLEKYKAMSTRSQGEVLK